MAGQLELHYVLLYKQHLFMQVAIKATQRLSNIAAIAGYWDFVPCSRVTFD